MASRAGNRSRLHHYVSKHYLRRFAFDRVEDVDYAKVWVRRRGSATVTSQAVKNVAVERDYHTLTLGDGSPSDWLDRHISELEAAAKQVCERLCADPLDLHSLTSDERGTVALYVAVLMATVPSRLRRSRESLEAATRTRERYQGLRKALEAGGPGVPKNAVHQVFIANSLAVLLERGLWRLLADRRWQLCTVPRNLTETLILADDPAISYVLPEMGLGGWARLICVPLDPRTLLVMHPVEGPDLGSMALRSIDVGLLNRKSWSQTERQAVAFDRGMLSDEALAGGLQCPGPIRLAPVGGDALAAVGLPAI